MTDSESQNPRRFQELFLEITGETTVREWHHRDPQETRSRGTASDPDSDGLSEDVIESSIADGLDEAIDTPDDSGRNSYE